MANFGRMHAGKFHIPISHDPAAVRKRVTALEAVLERSFTIPGTRQTVGLDAILGLVPIGGDTVAACLGLYMIWEARHIGMSRLTIMRMLWNVGLDWAIGLVPLVGDVADFFYRSNRKNLRLILRHLDKHHPSGAVLER